MYSLSLYITYIFGLRMTLKLVPSTVIIIPPDGIPLGPFLYKRQVPSKIIKNNFAHYFNQIKHPLILKFVKKQCIFHRKLMTEKRMTHYACLSHSARFDGGNLWIVNISEVLSLQLSSTIVKGHFNTTFLLQVRIRRCNACCCACICAADNIAIRLLKTALLKQWCVTHQYLGCKYWIHKDIT